VKVVNAAVAFATRVEPFWSFFMSKKCQPLEHCAKHDELPVQSA
jgi:hypothetical protein